MQVSNTTSTRDAILAASRRRFARAGFSATRLADIAADVGIRRPSLLYWFATKALLYAETVQTVFNEIERPVLASLDADGPLPHRIDAAVDALHAVFEESPAIAALVLHELTHDGGPGQEILLQRVVPLFAALETRLGDETGMTPAGLPVRSAVLTVAGGLLVRHGTSAGIRTALWGPHSVATTRAIARSVFLPPKVRT